jgi:hypothetical protein
MGGRDDAYYPEIHHEKILHKLNDISFFDLTYYRSVIRVTRRH